MPLATEMALPHLPVDELAFRNDPMPFIEAARLEHPWLARTDYGYFVHGYQAIKDIQYMDARMHPSFDELVEFYDVKGTGWAKFQVEQILGHTGEKHSRIRQSVGDAFTPRNVKRYRGVMRETASRLLDEWAPLGKFDFASFVSNYPIAVLCGLMGTGTEEIPRLKHSLETQTALLSMDHSIVPDLLEGHDILWDFVDKVIREREAGQGGSGGLIDQLIATKNNGLIDETELRYLLMVLFPAGYDTSKNMLTLTMYHMLTHQHYWERCAEDFDFCVKVTEETFRHTSTASSFRIVDEDFDYEGVTFPKGVTLIMGNSLAGRDPSAFERADVFDPEREHRVRHVAFGRGVHICLGQHLAKAQIAEGLHLMAQRITRPRLAGEIHWRPFLGVWGIRSLPIEFEPGEKRAFREELADA